MEWLTMHRSQEESGFLHGEVSDGDEHVLLLSASPAVPLLDDASVLRAFHSTGSIHYLLSRALLAYARVVIRYCRNSKKTVDFFLPKVYRTIIHNYTSIYNVVQENQVKSFR